MQFKNLHSRIAFIFLSLILVIQFSGFGAIQLSIEKNARDSVKEQLVSGENLFMNLLDHNGENLADAASILAADYGFRSAVASKDKETIISALTNHQQRISADIAAFYPADESQQAQVTDKHIRQELAIKLPSMIQEAQDKGSSRDFILINNQPYQLVIVPVKAPLTIGWIVMGFEINNIVAHRLQKLTNLEITFMSKTAPTGWTSSASTLYPAAIREVLNQSNKINPILHKTSEISIGKVDFGTRYVPIIETDQQTLYVVLQRSISEAISPFEALQLNLLILTILGAFIFVAGSILTAKKITQPLTELAKTADLLAQGHYDIKINSDREDELGQLSRAFKRMMEAIAIREKNILKLAYWDEMTNLPNRASFIIEFGNAIEEAKLIGESVAILVIDLDRFKQINNVLGNSIGDEILKVVADRFKSSTKDKRDQLVRYGGDEFAILIPGIQTEPATRVAKRLLKGLDQPIQVGDHSVDLSASVGIAVYPTHGEYVEQLLSRAEIAMYAAKSQNVGVMAFDSGFDVSNQNNLTLASELKIAIEKNQLALYIQPKIDLISGQVNSVEALVRWNHPDKGLLYPDSFIPFAEQTGYIRKISLWMLAEAAAFAATWQQAGIKIPIAVNLSARDLVDQDLPKKIESILLEKNIDVDSITIEITESSIMDDPARSENTLEALSAMGIKLAIDDFGTGYSSLANLKKLPISELKIDKSFVLKMADDQSDRKIVRSTVDLGHNLGLKVVAEGIESQEVWSYLASIGCDYGQGYFISKPIPANDFVPWMTNWNNENSAIKATVTNVFIESPSRTLN